MGVPDFVKFIARSSPGALCRLPKGNSAQPLVFDFILIDATNAAQTLGLDALLAFLHPRRIVARSAIIFALDSQRDRSGTARSHRHALVRIGDLDVHVQKLCSQLVETYRTFSNSNGNSSANRGGAASLAASPHVVTSGRGVAGEADYKLLDLQRTLIASAVAAGATALPSFLFVTEDSDVLCGALCGPAPQQVSIATKLQDVLYEPSILRLDRVLAFIATCTDAFYAENEREAAVAAAAKAKVLAERNAAKAKAAAAQSTAAPQKGKETHSSKPEAVAAAEAEEEEDDVQLSVDDTAVAAPPPTKPEEDVVRRRKQDGPMVATGVRIELSDSSEDDDEPEGKEEEEEEEAKSASAKSTTAPAAEKSQATASAGTTSAAAAAGAVAVDAAPTEGELTVSAIAYTSSVDMVFLFIIVMGNAVNVPSLVRGATKVDAGSCWQAYCKQKYKILSASEAETGRALLTTSAQTHSTNKGSLTLNCQFLHAILEAVHYADAEARPPGEEEKQRAIAYLSNAVYATLRYVVGCNLEKTPTLQQTFLDSRPLSETAVMLPSLSAVMWVLGQEATRTFTFPLHGLAKRELLTAASGGAAPGSKDAADGSNGGAANLRDATASAGDLDVGDHLVAPVAANAWAVRGARTNIVPLSTLVQAFAVGRGSAASSTAATLRAAPMPSMTELLKRALQKVAPARLAKANLLVYLTTVWEYALGLGVRRIAALTKAAANVARAEGGEEVFTAVQATSSTGNVLRAKEAGGAAAGVAGAKSGAGASAGGHYVYSFELRRMAPVLQASDTTTAAGNAAAATLSSSSSPSGSLQPGDAPANSASAGGSAAQQAILSALGVSYDYTKAPRRAENVVNLPHSAMDEEDKAELQRLKKVAKKERALAASVAAAAQGEKPDATADDDASDDEGKKGGARKSKEGKKAKDKAKGKKRLGKRERLQRQKAMGKAESK